MATAAQIAANRANAAHSTGPRTADGKQRASRNSLKHGDFARRHGALAVRLLAGESQAGFSALREAYLALYRPAGEVQFFLVGRLTLAAWRLHRLAGLEARVVSSLQDAALRHASFIQSLTELRGLDVPDRAGGDPVAEAFIRDSERGNALTKLARHQSFLERSYYQALHELESRIRRDSPET